MSPEPESGGATADCKIVEKRWGRREAVSRNTWSPERKHPFAASLLTNLAVLVEDAVLRVVDNPMASAPPPDSEFEFCLLNRGREDADYAPVDQLGSAPDARAAHHGSLAQGDVDERTSLAALVIGRRRARVVALCGSCAPCLCAGRAR